MDPTLMTSSSRHISLGGFLSPLDPSSATYKTEPKGLG